MGGKRETVLVDAAEARAYAERVFEAVGLPPSDAAVVTDALLWAELRGVASHGLMRVPSYVERVQRGAINPSPDIRVVTSLPAARVVDGDGGHGQLAVTFAMQHAVDLARSSATGLVTIRACGHTGAAGYFTRMAAREGMIGMYVGGSRPSMAYPGTRSKSVATNPLSISVPGRGDELICLDMATSTASVGKLRHHRATGEPLGEGWALDDGGTPTTDPEAATVLTPAAGGKGGGMSLLFECMTSLLVGNALVAPALLGRAEGHGQNALVMAIDIAAFTDLDAYRAEVSELADAMKGQPLAVGTDTVLMPGERGDAMLAHRSRQGIPVLGRTWDDLEAVAGRLGVEPPPAAA